MVSSIRESTGYRRYRGSAEFSDSTVFDDPKTMAGVRIIPLPNAALQLLTAWKGQAKRTATHELIFSTVSGKANLTQQRLAAVGLASVSGCGPTTGDVAHVQADV